MTEDSPPISETLTVLGHETLYKTSKWWSEIVYLESYGRKQVAAYLWVKKKSGQWKRQNKYSFYHKHDWQRFKDVVDKFIQQLS
jgi:hypothetical protein